METVVTPQSNLNPLKRLMADTPPFWKIIGFIGKALLVVAGSFLYYHVGSVTTDGFIGVAGTILTGCADLAVKDGAILTQPITTDSAIKLADDAIEQAQATKAAIVADPPKPENAQQAIKDLSVAAEGLATADIKVDTPQASSNSNGDVPLVASGNIPGPQSGTAL